jgi:hypothetical protein
MHLDRFLDGLKTALPEVCTDADLIAHLPNFFKSPATLNRLRSQGQCPPFFSVHPHIYYLRSDVLQWLKDKYQVKEAAAHQGKQTPRRQKEKQKAVAETCEAGNKC